MSMKMLSCALHDVQFNYFLLLGYHMIVSSLRIGISSIYLFIFILCFSFYSN